jgi:L-Ala-D/L-Glu epimerase
MSPDRIDRASHAAPAGALRLDVALEEWPMAEPLKISGHTMTAAHVVVVTLGRAGHVGRGEGSGLFYLGDTPQALLERIEAVRPAIEAGVTRAALRALMAPGGARNAVDCALWELEARQAGQAVWQLAGLAAPVPLLTTFTVGADEPERMAAVATRRYPQARALKLKLLGDGRDGERVAAVRAARADVWLGVDGNQGFDIAAFHALLPALVAARVELVEQPFPSKRDEWLDGLDCPIELAADESALSLLDLPAVAARFDAVNIKLDKCGGLTEALAMAERARALGMRVMIGNMGGTSLAMAPALLVGQSCDVVDIDGPLFLRTDRSPSVVYEQGRVFAGPDVWGGQ